MTDKNENFLDLPPQLSDRATSRYVVLPVPYEGTVTYKPDTADGPAAIIDASGQVEFYDEELGGEFIEAGVATLPCVPPASTPAEQVARVRKIAQPLLAEGKFLLTLGGEHSITAGLVEAAAAACGDISALQIDAHADLRDEYEGEKYSHACVMRRVLEITDSICQVGIRNYSREEADACSRHVEKFFTPRRISDEPDWIDQAVAMLGEKVYVTIDIDGFDPAIAPGTGTPEPGGMTWRQVTELLRRVCTERQVVAADIMEVRPIPPNHITEFLAARLGYKIITYTQL